MAAYVAAFNSESPANQIALGTPSSGTHVSRAIALKRAIRQEPGAVVLGSDLGTFKAAIYHYKPLAVWVFALDPPGAHVQPTQFPSSKAVNSRYNYDVVIVRASSGAVIEEAAELDKRLPLLPPEKV